MRILGISAFYHDSAAALVATATSSRRRRKSASRARSTTPGFPRTRSRYCLHEGGRRPERHRPRHVLRQAVPEVRAAARDLSGFRAERLRLVPHGDAAVAEGEAVPEDAARRGAEASSTARSTGTSKLLFTEHHLSHAASAFYPFAVRRGRVLTMDGVGEWATTSLARSAAATSWRCSKEIHFPHSLGLLYSAFTYYTGFKVNSGEYKVMGLAPYGEPKLRRHDPRPPDRHQGGRLVPHEHGLLRLLHRPDDDERQVRRCSAARRASRKSC